MIHRFVYVGISRILTWNIFSFVPRISVNRVPRYGDSRLRFRVGKIITVAKINTTPIVLAGDVPQPATTTTIIRRYCFCYYSGTTAKGQLRGLRRHCGARQLTNKLRRSSSDRFAAGGAVVNTRARGVDRYITGNRVSNRTEVRRIPNRRLSSNDDARLKTTAEADNWLTSSER